MQEPELEYFKGGATLVISLAGFDWLSKRSRSDKGAQESDEELHLWMSMGQGTEAGEEPRPLACFRIPDRRRRRAAIQSLRDVDRGPCLASSCFLPKELIQPSTLTSPDVPKEAIMWTRLVLNLRDISGFNSNMATHPCDSFIICYNDFTPAPSLLGDFLSTQDCRTLVKHIGKNLPVDFKDSTSRWPSGLHSSSEDERSEADNRDNTSLHDHRSRLKSCRDCDPPGSSSKGDVKMRKSVSFDDDVLVFLFDQERPTVELQTEDSGLEWDDDFPAPEESRRPRRRCAFSLPSTPRPGRRLPPHQRCLYLTYVTEADLEL